MDLKTLCALGSPEPEGGDGALTPSIVTSATFAFPNQQQTDRYFESGEGYCYGRYGNPTVRSVERLLARLEGAGDASLFSSGMAAISTLFLTLARSGQRVAVQRELYGGAAHFIGEVLTRAGVEPVWFTREELTRLEPQRLEGCRLLYLETPVNPTLRVVDLSAAVELARKAGVPVAVDATFASPALMRPIELGVDYVVHSATKYLGGHGDLIGGVVSGGVDEIKAVADQRRSMGGVLDPFSAFLLHRGVGTLAVRMSAHSRTAAQIATRLLEDARVEQVFYPGLPDHPDHAIARREMDGFGGMVTFTVRGDGAAAERVHDSLKLFARAGSLGAIRSLVSIPAKMSHHYVDAETREAMGVPDNMIRLSVGLESVDDLMADLDRALGS